MNDLAKNRTNLIQILDKMGFIAKVSGKPYVLAPGLLWLFYSKGGGRSINIQILTHDTTNILCVTKATVTGIRDGVTYTATGLGDAGKDSCTRNILPSYIRMAGTRAIGRALRHYLGIGMCTLEELPIYEEDEHGQNTTPKNWPEDKPKERNAPPKPETQTLATPQDRDEILLLAARNNMDDISLADGIATRHKQGQLEGSTFAELTKGDALAIINGLKALTKKETN
jgi:hypothetical protein